MHTSNAGPVRFALFLLATTLVTLPIAAQQQIYNVTVSLGSGNGSLTYQEVVTQTTCMAAAKYTYHYTRINDGNIVYLPAASSQIPMSGSFTLISGSPGTIPQSNCPKNGVIGHPLTLLQKNYQIYVQAQSTGYNAITATYVPGTFGYVNPKYVVAGVLYAPPGSKSSAVYTNSKTVSSTIALTNTFTSSTTVSDSTQVLSGVPAPVPVLRLVQWNQQEHILHHRNPAIAEHGLGHRHHVDLQRPYRARTGQRLHRSRSRLRPD